MPYEGEDYYVLAEQLGIMRATAYNIIRRCMENNGVVAQPRGGARFHKVTQAIKETLISIVEEQPEFTLNQINSELRSRLPNEPEIGITTLANTLNGQLLVMTKTRRFTS